VLRANQGVRVVEKNRSSTLTLLFIIPQKKERQRIIRRIGQLADDPRPAGSRKLSGHDRYRIRQGAYHIVYSINDEEVIVAVVKLGHRKDVYRNAL
jgi:mRNA interferase RelE/StbE